MKNVFLSFTLFCFGMSAFASTAKDQWTEVESRSEGAMEYAKNINFNLENQENVCFSLGVLAAKLSELQGAISVTDFQSPSRPEITKEFVSSFYHLGLHINMISGYCKGESNDAKEIARLMVENGLEVTANTLIEGAGAVLKSLSSD
jgi:hypothetical protein